ncbi:MAG: AraC family transcriptional regulator [Lachnospiraceae bacterium]|nr:AraC family transcriptional regulator [Lachnospiraceae bacterium]
MKREQMGLIVKREDGSEIVNYDSESFPSYIYDGWVKPHVTWEKVPHFHEDLEFITVKSGNMAYSVNGKTVMLHEGDTIFVNSNQIHYSIAVEEEVARYVIFVVHPSVLKSSVAVEMEAILPILTNPNLPYIRFRGVNENTEEIRKLMMTLPEMRRDPFHITKQLFAIWEIIMKQSSSYGELEPAQSTDTHMRSFKNMMYFIQSEYQNSITLEQIAAQGNVGKSMCNKLFHQYAGLSPVGYLLDFRVRKVAELLSTTSCNLSEIAAMTGFNGVSYMSEMFKKSFGLSPLQYRTSQRERIG